jgi:hypothetical protein
MKTVPLSGGYLAVVDDADYDLVSRHSWSLVKSKNGRIAYAHCKRLVTPLMHRLIMQPKDGELIDHLNGIGLDNRRENLRVVNYHENLTNSYKHREGKLRGIDKIYSKWRVRVGGQHVGMYDDLEDAMKAYDNMALALYGDRAVLYSEGNTDLSLQ